jgi:hypothetical protein
VVLTDPQSERARGDREVPSSIVTEETSGIIRNYRTDYVLCAGKRGLSLIAPFGIFGDQKIIHARIKLMNLVDHRIIFEE